MEARIAEALYPNRERDQAQLSQIAGYAALLGRAGILVTYTIDTQNPFLGNP